MKPIQIKQEAKPANFKSYTGKAFGDNTYLTLLAELDLHAHFKKEKGNIISNH